MADSVEELRELKQELVQAAEALRESLRLHKDIIEMPGVLPSGAPKGVVLKPKTHPYFTYPRDGTKKTVGRGITMLNFWDGTVELADGTDDWISDKLQAYRDEEFIRSFQIDSQF